jgi:hypothetical protein
MTFFLCACSGGGEDGREAFLNIRAYYISKTEEGKLSLSAKMTADYGDRVYVYKLSYSGTGETGEISVAEPVIVEGLKAVYDRGEVTLAYDGAELDTGALIGGTASPLQAFPLLIEAWKTGYVSSCWRETRGKTGCVAAEIILGEGEGNGVLCRAWFDAEDYAPVYSEISVNGFTALYCEFV